MESLRTEREAAAGNAPVSSAEVTLSVSKGEAGEPEAADVARVGRLAALKRTAAGGRLIDRRDRVKRRKQSSSGVRSSTEYSRKTVSEGKHELKQAYEQD